MYAGPGSHIAYLAPTQNDHFISDSTNNSLPDATPVPADTDIYSIPIKQQTAATAVPSHLSVHEQLAIATKAFDNRLRKQ